LRGKKEYIERVFCSNQTRAGARVGLDASSIFIGLPLDVAGFCLSLTGITVLRLVTGFPVNLGQQSYRDVISKKVTKTSTTLT
jgi:hypothetical protein